MRAGKARWLTWGAVLLVGLGLALSLWRASGYGRGPAAAAPEEPEGPPLSGRERALAETKKMGGKVEPDERDPDLPGVRVDLRQAQDPDAGVGHVRTLGEVRALDLAATAVSDEGLRPLE